MAGRKIVLECERLPLYFATAFALIITPRGGKVMADGSSSRAFRYLYLLADTVILILCLFHIPSIVERGHFPFAVSDQNGSVIITEITSPLLTPLLSIGDRLVSVNGVLPRATFELQLVADTKKKHDQIMVAADHGGTEVRTSIALLPYYDSMRFVLLTFFVGMVMLILSGMLIFSIPHEPLVHYLHNIIVTLSAALMLTWGTLDSSLLTAITTTLFFLSYILFGFIFLLFSRALWKPHAPVPSWIVAGMHGIIVLYAGWISYLYLSSATTLSLEQFRIFSSYLFAFRLFVVLSVCTGMGMLIASLAKRTTPEEATRLRWIIGGILAGGIPYTLFGIIPVTLFGVDAFAEELSTLFFLLIPICVSVAFIRYNLLNLRSFVRRQRIYTTIRLLIYLCIVFISAVLAGHVYGAGEFDSYIVATLITGSAVALLLPAGKIFEQYIDERLFETKLNFRKILKDSVAELHTALDDRSLFQYLTAVIQRSLPVHSVAIYQNVNGALEPINSGIDNAQNTALPETVLRTVAGNNATVVALASEGIQDIHFDYAVLVRRSSGDVAAFIGLMMEMRNDRLVDEDRDFLSALAAEVSQMMERFRMQEEIILKKNEAQRLKEMDALKSFFVSSVSHDLRLPLTSIQMYADMLRSNTSLSTHKKRDFIRTILGETRRLTRHVENILDLNSIEHRQFRLEFSSLDVRRIVRRAVHAMQYEIKKHSARIRLSLPKSPLLVSADETALERVVMNLLSNALKYSLPPKKITIAMKRHDTSSVQILVGDNGIGIPTQEQSKVFAPFYRVRRSSGERATSGMGIGLAVVKYIVEQHHGMITLQSGAKKGTKITVTLPLIS
ncbi:MAG: ATP-binding protein [Bacteroidota bacterium]